MQKKLRKDTEMKKEDACKRKKNKTKIRMNYCIIP